MDMGAMEWQLPCLEACSCPHGRMCQMFNFDLDSYLITAHRAATILPQLWPAPTMNQAWSLGFRFGVLTAHRKTTRFRLKGRVASPQTRISKRSIPTILPALAIRWRSSQAFLALLQIAQDFLSEG